VGVLGIIDILMGSREYINGDNNMESLLSTNSLHISLEARMNQITPQGASNIFDRIILSCSNQTLSVASNKEEEGTHETNPPDVLSFKGEESSRIYIDLLDLAFNDIGHGKGEKKDIVLFHKSLRRLIENEFGCCPRILRLDVCGIGAPSCRAIGKVWCSCFHIA
jgi:hypothetical protein